MVVFGRQPGLGSPRAGRSTPRARHPGRPPLPERVPVRAARAGGADRPGPGDLPTEVGPHPMVNKETPLKIAVTGGAGLFRLATVPAAPPAGHDGWAFDHVLCHDVLGNLDALADADVVIHLAGVLGTSELFDMPETALDVNIKGTLRVLEWCRRHRAAYVGISMPDPFPSVYTATKVAARRL